VTENLRPPHRWLPPRRDDGGEDHEIHLFGIHADRGEALQPRETALTLYWKNGKVATTDGPYAETKEQLGGLGVLEARDMNHAIQLLSQHPTLKYGTLCEIRPIFDMSEMIRESEQRRRKVAAR